MDKTVEDIMKNIISYGGGFELHYGVKLMQARTKNLLMLWCLDLAGHAL